MTRDYRRIVFFLIYLWLWQKKQLGLWKHPPRSKDWKHANKQLIFHQVKPRSQEERHNFGWPYASGNPQFHYKLKAKKEKCFSGNDWLVCVYDRAMTQWSGYSPTLCHNKWGGCFPVLSRINFWHVGLYWCLQRNKQHLSVLTSEVLKLILATTTMDCKACTTPGPNRKKAYKPRILHRYTFLLHRYGCYKYYIWLSSYSEN